MERWKSETMEVRIDVRPFSRDPADGDASHRRRTQTTGHNWTITINFVFLKGGMIGPDIMSHKLLRAGDTESKPGQMSRRSRTTMKNCSMPRRSPAKTSGTPRPSSRCLVLGEGRSCMLSHGDDLARGSLPRERGPPTHPSRYATSSGLCSGKGQIQRAQLYHHIRTIPGRETQQTQLYQHSRTDPGRGALTKT